METSSAINLGFEGPQALSQPPPIKLRSPSPSPPPPPPPPPTPLKHRGEQTNKGSTSSLRDFSLPTGQQLRTQSCSRWIKGIDVDAHKTPSLDAHHENATPEGCGDSAAKHRAKDKDGMGSGGGMLQKHQATMKPGMSSTGGVPQKHQATMRPGMSLIGGMPQKHQATMRPGMNLRGGMPQKHHTMMKPAMSSSGGMPQKHHTTMRPCMSSGGGMPQKHHAMMKPGMSVSGGMPQKHHAMMKPGISSSGGLPQRNHRKEKMRPSQFPHRPPGIQVARIATELHAPRTSSGYIGDAYTCSSLDAHHGSTIAQDSEESAANEIVHVAEVNRNREEAECAIQELNKLGLGEYISDEEFLDYHDQLPCEPPRPDTSTKLSYAQLDDLDIRHALCRLKYKLSKQQVQKNELHNDKLKEYIEKDGDELKEDYCYLNFFLKNCENCECIKKDDSKLQFLQKHGYFKHFENDGTLDWSFHPDYCWLASLDDYQRLVPWNIDRSYRNWDEYRRYFHSYEVDAEYLSYCEELSKKLKWMEGYAYIEPLSSLNWGRISSRGAYQAIKIATGFSKITVNLAYTGYHDYVDNMRFDVCLLKELDGIYFEIWQRVTKLKKSFRDAFDEVCKLNTFPLRQANMKNALENENDCSKVEEQFYTCTKGITGEVTDDRARELIAGAVENQWRRPKFYEHYVRKKMDIARAIGLIPRYTLGIK